MRFFLLFLSILSFSTFAVSGGQLSEQEFEVQDSEPAPTPLDFNEENIKKYKEDPHFDYSEKISQDNWWTRFKAYVILQYQKFLNWLFGDYEANSILRFLVEILPYLIILGILFLAIWIFYRMDPGSALLSDPEEAKVFLSEDEKIIKSQDIQHMIEQALADRNYRLAIRYYYLLILQLLTHEELISYENSKTDEDYVKEIKLQPLQQQFRKLTRIYDFIWYGNFEASEQQYRKSKREFENMKELIKNTNE